VGSSPYTSQIDSQAFSQQFRTTMPINGFSVRYQAFRLLRAHGIPCVLWFEDAIAHYGVPIIVFELYVLVLDHDEAAHVLESHWTRTTHEQDRIGNKDVTSSPQHHLTPPSTDNHQPTIVPASNWYFDLNNSAMGALNPTSFVPPLPALLDAMILDGPPDLWSPLRLHVSYLYGYVPELRQRMFAQRLRYENRQFHSDVLFGTPFNTLPFAAHERRVRAELRAGKRQLQDCSVDLVLGV
jgi:hypothetical protein